VTFIVDGVSQGNVTLSNGQATFSSSALSVGSHTVTVAYNGDGSFNTSSSAGLSQTVNKASSATVVSTSANPSVFGQAVTFTTTVSAVAPGAGTATGTVTFKVDGVAQPNVTLSNGQATFSSSTLSVGSHTVTVAYNGDGNFNTSSSASFSQTVNKASSATTVSASANPSVFGQPVTFTATVSAVAPGAGTPTGTVTFTVDGLAQPNVTLSNGQATFSSATLSVGSHTVTVAYNGDGNFTTSSSASLGQTVNKASSATTVSASANPSVFGQAVTFTATVSAVAPGAGTPTGTVTFTVDGVAQPNVTLSAGQATLTTTTLSVGAHTVTAAYNGDGNFTTSTSASFTQTVNKASSSTAVSASVDPLVSGQAVTLTARVSAVAPGAGTPTGTVTFTIDGVAQPNVTLSSGQATFTTSTLSVGAHTVSVAYNGDSSFTTSASDTSSTNTALGAAGDYALLYEGTGGHNLSVTNVTVNGDIGVGGTGVVQFSGPGTIAGRLDFSAANVGQLHNNNGSNVGPNSANYTVAAATNALNTVNSLNSSLAGLGSSLAISGTQTINESAGQLVTVNGAAYRVFNVTSYSETDGKLVTINGDGSGNPVVLNFGFNSNVNLGGDVALTGGLSDDQVLWNFTTSGQNVSLNNNASSYPLPAAFHGIILAPNDVISLSNANLDGRVFGGASSDMQIAGGVTINAPLTLTVNKANSSTTVSFQTGLLSETYTATVSPIAPGAGTPTGTVTFIVDGTAQSPTTLSNGQASITFLAVLGILPSHTVSAGYNGDSNFKASTATAASSSVNASVFGQAVAFTAVVSATAGTPTGTITFTVDGVAQPNVTLSNGQATFTTSTLSVGSHTITAAYNGDGSFSISSAGSFTQTVNQASTATALSSSLNPSTYSQSVTYTAIVSATAPGAGTPTGTVTFKDGSTTLGTGTLAGGSATFTISTLTGGSHSITAVYGGDTNFVSSTSATLTQTVNQASTTTTVTSSANPSAYGFTLTFTATVSSAAGTPTGTVTFTVDGVAQPNVTLSNGQATFSSSTLIVGPHTITVAYNSDGNFATSTSANLGQTITSSPDAWPHPELVTISFEPDGTIIGSNGGGYIYSNLFATFNALFGSAATWENEILKAAQLWAQQTNINFTVVPDNGAKIGSGSYQQGDPNMGDIRIGGYNFGDSTLAQTYLAPPDNNYSIAGDIQFNTGQTFNIGTTYDVQTVALHELGHALGLDHSTVAGAVMYAYYGGTTRSLSNNDITAIRATYSNNNPRSSDVYNGANNSFANAANLTSLLNLTSLTGLVQNLDISSTGQADYYTVTAPQTTSTTFTVKVQSSGLSLLKPRLTVYAADQVTVLGYATGTGYQGSTLSVTVTGIVPGQQLYIKVAGADTTAFGTGKYALTMNFGTGQSPTVPLPNTQTLNGTPLSSGGGQPVLATYEIQVNTCTAGTQQTDSPQSVAMDAQGDYVVVWSSNGQDGSGWGVYGQRYNAAGVSQGSEFRVNTTTAGDQRYGAVAMDQAGDFVVTWSSNGQDGSGWGIYAQRYNAAGVPQGGEFQVNTTTAGDQMQSTVAMDSAGDFVISWQSYGQDGSGWGIYAQRYNAAGVAQGGEFRVNTTTTGDQEYPSAAMDAAGDFVITWSSNGQDGSGWGIYAQRYNAAGVPQGGEFQVNTYTAGDQEYSTVAMDATGDFVITWSSHGQAGSGWGIYAQRYNAAGVPQGGEFQVSPTTATDQLGSSVSMDPRGDLIVGWSSYRQDGSGWDIFAQQYDSTGMALGGQFQINLTTTANQRTPSVAITYGKAEFVWSANGPGDPDAVFGKNYTLSTADDYSPPPVDPGTLIAVPKFQDNTIPAGVQAPETIRIEIRVPQEFQLPPGQGLAHQPSFGLSNLFIMLASAFVNPQTESAAMNDGQAAMLWGGNGSYQSSALFATNHELDLTDASSSPRQQGQVHDFASWQEACDVCFANLDWADSCWELIGLPR
jgi:oligoribonuclease NrnB/cAMP/cGMP phosphodiesterase (DHH superfamily)